MTHPICTEVVDITVKVEGSEHFIFVRFADGSYTNKWAKTKRSADRILADLQSGIPSTLVGSGGSL